MKRNQRWGEFNGSLGAFTLGVTAGSIAAILFAPSSGQVTRKRIGMQFRSLENKATRQIRYGKRLLTKKAHVLRKAAVA